MLHRLVIQNLGDDFARVFLWLDDYLLKGVVFSCLIRFNLKNLTVGTRANLLDDRIELEELLVWYVADIAGAHPATS